MTFDDAFASLNPEQKAAASHIDGPMMVLAGPGTGKTQIIALRIARILQQSQLEPHNILCLTFTESGAVAMRKRLLKFIGTAAYYVRIHTFHSFCNDVIKEYPEKFLFSRELEPLDEIERIGILQKILDELPDGGPLKPFADPYFYQKEVKGKLSELKREGVAPEAFSELLDAIEKALEKHGESIENFIAIHGGSLKLEELLAMQKELDGTLFARAMNNVDIDDKKSRTEAKNALKAVYEDMKNQLPKQKALLKLYGHYQEELQRRGRYDYEDMILFVKEKLKTDAELLARLQEQFQYILVDEYQDTNGAQNEVVRLLGSYYKNPNIFVVGDDKQSIYRFQGAALENMVEFYLRFKDSIELVSLQENYRSQQMILDAASSLIHHNLQGLETIIPELKQKLNANVSHTPEKVRIAELSSPSAERYFLARQVQTLIAAGTEPSEIAIFYRNNRDVDELANLFLRMQIPFHLHAGKNLLNDPELQKLIGLLEWISDPTNDRRLFFVLHYDFLNYPPLEILKLTRRAADQKKGLWDMLEEAPEPLKSLREKSAEWSAASVNKTLAEFFELVLRESGYLENLLKKPDRLEQLNRLNTFFDQIKAWNKKNPKLRLKEFIATLQLLAENDIPLPEAELVTQKNAISLMTAHHSKGLEFEHIFMMHCVDKHWSNVTARAKLKLPETLLKTVDLVHKEKNEDERRLFYVGLTRAKKTATLSFAKINENGKEQVPAIFLAELDPETTQAFNTSPTEEDLEARMEANFTPIVTAYSSEEEAFLKGLLQNYTLSVTHLNNYLRCPRLFYYDNVLRVPRAKGKSEAFGTAIHEALKDLLSPENPDSKEFLLTRFERHLHREILNEKDFKGSLDFGRLTLEAYFDRYQNEFKGPALLEYNFQPHGVHVNSVPITGKLDKIQILDPLKKTVHTVDYKTGNPDGKSPELGPNGSYRRQIIFYQLLCDLSTQFPYTMVSGEIDFVQKSVKKNDFVKSRFEVTSTEKEELIKTIEDTYADIMDLKFLRPDEWATCGECEYCLAFGTPTSR